MRSRSPGRDAVRSPIRLLQATTFVSTLDRFAMPPMLVVIAGDAGRPAGRGGAGRGALLPRVRADAAGVGSGLRPAGPGPHPAACPCCWPGSRPPASALSRERRASWASPAAWPARSSPRPYPASLIYVGDTVPGDRRQHRDHRPDDRRRAGHRAGLGRRRRPGADLRQLAVASPSPAALRAGPGRAAAAAARAGPDGAPADAAARAAPAVSRSGITLLLLLLAFVEGAVLLGALTLLPRGGRAHRSDRGRGRRRHRVCTASPCFLGARLVGRLSPHWHRPG